MEERRTGERRQTTRETPDRRGPSELERIAVTRIQAAYVASGQTMVAVAVRAGVSYGTLWNILNNRKIAVRVSTLEAIAIALEIPPQKLFTAA